MHAQQFRTLLQLSESAAAPPVRALRHLSEGGLGGHESTVDDHLDRAVHHATASLTAARLGDGEAAAHHSQRANAHLAHATAKQRAEDHPSAHGRDEKMVFGVWRKVGGQHTPADHQAIGDKYTRHASRQKKKIDAQAMLAGTHPSEVPHDQRDHHYKAVKQSLAMAKTHYAGQDPMDHPKVAAHPHKQGQGGDKPAVHDAPAGGEGGGSPSTHEKDHAFFAKTYGDQKMHWNIEGPKAGGGSENLGSFHGTYADAHRHAAGNPKFHTPGTRDHRGSIHPAHLGNPSAPAAQTSSRRPSSPSLGENERPLSLIPSSHHNPPNATLRNVDPHPYLHHKHPDAAPGAKVQIKGHNYVKGQNGKWRYSHRTPITP